MKCFPETNTPANYKHLRITAVKFFKHWHLEHQAVEDFYLLIGGQLIDAL